MKVLAIIQARMGSTRLPGKVLRDLHGKKILEIIIERVSMSDYIDQIAVATSIESQDDLIEAWCDSKHLACFRGSEDDVLDRFYKTASYYNGELIVRITADDPLKDSKIIDRAIASFRDDKELDYCSNTIIPSYPEGLDIEVFTFSALQEAWTNAKLPSEREHVTPYIWKNNDHFKTKNFRYREDLSTWRWTLDTPKDLLFFEEIFLKYKNNMSVDFEEVINFLKDNDHLTKINEGILRNEGYLKSTSKER